MDTNSLGRLIPLSSIYPSSTNPRKRFNEIDLQELAESIKQHGVMQPILVRPTNVEDVKNGTDHYFTYEIVAGERRYRASKLAGNESIPAIERELSDLETLQLQIIENLQRSDLHPLEEAQGFKALLDNKDAKSWNADELAAKIGKSRSYIYGSLKLNELCTYAQDMFLDGKFGREIALLIARIPGAKLQEQATKQVISGDFSYRNAKSLIRNNYTLDLSKAPWDKHSITLYPAAGSCLSCSKRTGNYPELYPDIESTDVCTDTACFASKKVAYAKDVIETNPRAIHGEDAKKIAPFGVSAYVQGGFTSNPNSTYIHGHYASEILGEDMPAPYILVDEKHETKLVYKSEEIETLMKQKLEEKISSGEIVIKPEEKSDWQIKRDEREKKQAAENERRKAIFNRLVPHIGGNDLLVLRRAIDMIREQSSADFSPILDIYQFNGTEEEFFTDFQSHSQDIPACIKLITLLILVPGIETGFGWESSDDNDEDYDRLIGFIGNIGLDVSQFLTAELPFTPNPAALAQELTTEMAAAADEKPALSPKLQEIKDKELAKRARRAKSKEQKESANADA